MGTDSWGQVTVPAWALRFKELQVLIDEYGDSVGEEAIDAVGECYFESGSFVRNDEFPETVHGTLQQLQIPYDYSFALAMGEGGARAGGWRPGMATPLEYPIIEGERVFALGELRATLGTRGPAAVRLARIAALVQERDQLLKPVNQWPDPRAVHAQSLRSRSSSQANSRPRVPRRL